MLSDEAHDGEEAYEKVVNSFKCCGYKLVLMDCNMPVLDGF